MINGVFFLVVICQPNSFIKLNRTIFVTNKTIIHIFCLIVQALITKQRAFVYTVATYGTVPFSLIILCHMWAIYSHSQ